MIHTNIWKPDTCSCTIVYQWDDAVPVEKRVHTPVKDFTNDRNETFTTEPCSEHAEITDHETLHQVVQSENVTKNQLKAKLMENHPELTRQLWNSKSGPIPVEALNPAFVASLPPEELTNEFITEPVITFTKTVDNQPRDIAVDHPDLTPTQVQTALDTVAVTVTVLTGKVG